MTFVPTFALVPDPHAPEGWRAIGVPSEQYVFRAVVVQPVDLRASIQSTYTPVETVKIDVQRYGRIETLAPRDRRQRARANGRRRAVAVPVARRWEARVAAHPDVPAYVVRRFVEAQAVIVERVWTRKGRA